MQTHNTFWLLTSLYFSMSLPSPILHSLQISFLHSCHIYLLVLWTTNQGHLYDHGFGTVHWILMGSPQDIQLEQMTPPSQNLSADNSSTGSGGFPQPPTPSRPNCWQDHSCAGLVQVTIAAVGSCIEDSIVQPFYLLSLTFFPPPLLGSSLSLRGIFWLGLTARLSFILSILSSHEFLHSLLFCSKRDLSLRAAFVYEYKHRCLERSLMLHLFS